MLRCQGKCTVCWLDINFDTLLLDCVNLVSIRCCMTHCMVFRYSRWAEKDTLAIIYLLMSYALRTTHIMFPYSRWAETDTLTIIFLSMSYALFLVSHIKKIAALNALFLYALRMTLSCVDSMANCSMTQLVSYAVCDMPCVDVCMQSCGSCHMTKIKTCHNSSYAYPMTKNMSYAWH